MKVLTYYFIYPLSVFLFDVWLYLSFLNDNFYDFACDEYDVVLSSYDYIIVGAGSAGIMAALRLAQNSDNSILLIEAGGYATFPLNIPVIGPLIQRSSYDWQHKTVPQKHACFGLENNRSIWPAGRIVGGTSRLNNMLYLRGHSRDFDNWSAANNPTWGYNEQARYYFRKSECQLGKYKNDTLYHGYDGLLAVDDLSYQTPLADAVVNSGARLGFNVGDLNGKNQTGFMKAQVITINGSRYTLDRLLEMHSKNIRLITNSVVDKILFKGNFEAVGVRIRRQGKRKRINARKSVILTAGVIGTPKLLMLSGIGPREHLKELGIPVVNDLPVGQNLQDHVTTGEDLIKLKTKLPLSYSALLNPFSGLNYFKNGKGPWTFPGCEALGLVHTKYADPNVDPPDLQFMVIPAGVSSDGGVTVRKNQGLSQKLWEEYFKPLIGEDVVSIVPVLLHPKSRGEVRLRSRNYLDRPIIDPQYLKHPDDVKVLVEGINLVKKLIATKSMQALGAELNSKPLPGCEHHVFDSKPYWECYVRHLTLTAYHYVGTCKMGPSSDPTTVVDSFLRVHGTHRLRVMDASVMPTLISGNINAAVFMIAEKGVDMLKNYWHHISRVCLKMEVFIPSHFTFV